MRLTRRTDLQFLGGSAFAGFRFPPDVIVLAVRWYLRFGLSYRDVEELLAERGIEVDHVTVHRWVAAIHATAGGCGPVRPAPGRGPLARR
jgi:hypothetical protein